MARATFEEVEMATKTIEDFAKDWHISNWSPPKAGPIPKDAFVVGQPLGIWAPIVQPNAPKVCEVTWTTGAGQKSSIRLTFNKEDGTLSAFVEVPFGAEHVLAQVTLSIDSNGVLLGELDPPGDSGGNTGTFAADTNPPLPDEE